MIDKGDVRILAYESHMEEYEDCRFDVSLDELVVFVNKVIDFYEEGDDDFDYIDDKNTNERYGFTSYGKKEDWE